MPNISFPIDLSSPQSILNYLSTPDGVIHAFIVVGIIAFLGFILWLVDNLFAPIAVMAHGIVGFFGKRGSGKSFGMTAYARRWRHFNPNKPVFTNMEKLNLPGSNESCKCYHKHVPLDDEAELDTHNQCTYILNKCRAVHTNCNFAQISACRDGLICIDEAGVFISSLNFADRRNRQFAKWLIATRHFKVMVLLTAHTPGTINNRLRDVVDQFVEMTAFTTLKLFRGYIYDSGKVYGVPDKKSHTIWIPMLFTVSNAYNTDSLRIQADKAESNILGDDFDLPGLGEAMEARTTGNTRATRQLQTTTVGEGFYNGDTREMGTVLRPANQPVPSGVSADSISIGNYSVIDANLLDSLISQTVSTWAGRKAKPTTTSRTRPPTRRVR